MGDIILSNRQQRRLEVLARLASGKLTQEEAARLLGCSGRTVRRLAVRFCEEGPVCVVHGNAGRAPVHKTPEPTRQRVLELAGPEGPYHDFNLCHLRSALAREEQITLGRSTLERLLKAAGVRRPSRRARRRAYQRRERSAQEGFMLLIDGSLHDWLEGRDPRYPRMCLIGAIDDATGKIIYLHFWPTECLAAYLLMLESIAGTHGLPELLYHDKHTILRSPKAPTIEDELAGHEPASQFQRVLALLGIEGVAAHSPQAKGRIERLWETLQDRLIKEMRLAGVATLEAANAFLDLQHGRFSFLGHYNQEFAVTAADPEPAWVGVDAKMDLPFYFAAKEERTVRADHTLSWLGQTLLLARTDQQPCLAGKRVAVHIDPHGQLFVYHAKTRLAYRLLAAQAPRPDAKPADAKPADDRHAPNAPRGAHAKASANPHRRAWLYASP